MSTIRNKRQINSEYSAISTRIVKHLHSQGKTLKEIGSLMGLKESYISRVYNGQRGLTLEHLTRLENALGKSLPAILIHSTPLDSVPKKLRPAYKAFDAFLATLMTPKK